MTSSNDQTVSLRELKYKIARTVLTIVLSHFLVTAGELKTPSFTTGTRKKEQSVHHLLLLSHLASLHTAFRESNGKS
jgi:hypothetical protein